MDQYEETYTVALALFDVVPVVLSVIGCWFLARLSTRVVPAVGGVALAAVAILAVGGGSKALWKIILTTADSDITWMEQLLFPLLSVGFTLLAWAVWSGLVGRTVPWWPFALVLALGIAGAVAARSMQPLLGVTATMSLITSGLGVRWAVRERTPAAGVLFVLGMVSAIVLAFLGSDRIVQTLAMQWIEESVNVAGQACFLLASYLLWRADTSHRSAAAAAAVPSESAVDA
jgi:hypothetical protein